MLTSTNESLFSFQKFPNFLKSFHGGGDHICQNIHRCLVATHLPHDCRAPAVQVVEGVLLHLLRADLRHQAPDLLVPLHHTPLIIDALTLTAGLLI